MMILISEVVFLLPEKECSSCYDYYYFSNENAEKFFIPNNWNHFHAYNAHVWY